MRFRYTVLAALLVVGSAACGGTSIPSDAQVAIDPCQVVSAENLHATLGAAFVPEGPSVVTADGGRACTFSSETGIRVTVALYPDTDGRRYQQAAQKGTTMPGAGDAVLDLSDGHVTVHKGVVTATLVATGANGRQLVEQNLANLVSDIQGGLARG